MCSNVSYVYIQAHTSNTYLTYIIYVVDPILYRSVLTIMKYDIYVKYVNRLINTRVTVKHVRSNFI